MTKPFRCIYVNCFNILRFFCGQHKIEKMHFFRLFKDDNSGREYENYTNDPIFSIYFFCSTCFGSLRPATLLKRESLTQMFSCEFCEISRNTVFYRTPPVAAFPNRGYLHCAFLKALHGFQEKRALSQGICNFFLKVFQMRFSRFSECLKRT